MSNIYRLGFMMLSLSLVLGLFIGGAQPEAAGWFQAPVDKLVHFFYFAIFTFAVIMSNIMPLRYAGLLTTMLGAADEFHQILLPGRFAGIGDWLADCLGAFAVVYIFSIIRAQKNTVRQHKKVLADS